MKMRAFIFLVTFGLCQAVITKIPDDEYQTMPEIFEMDNYDQCFLLKEKAVFCLLEYVVKPLNETDPSQVYKTIEIVNQRELNYNHSKLRKWLCNHKSCPSVDKQDSDEEKEKKFQVCLDERYNPLGLKGEVKIILCETPEKKYEIGNLEIIFAAVILSYLALVMFATIYEGIARYKPPEEYEKINESLIGRIICAFSITKNWFRLKTVTSTPDIERLRSIQGIRVYTMMIVIFSHTALSYVGVPISNPKYAETMTEKVLCLFLASGPLCVQTFFMMSSWLLFYNIFDYLKDKKDVSIGFLVFVFINRCIRLSPTLAVVILFQSTWMIHLGSGPIWDMVMGMEHRNCRKNGWSNLLYINNYIDPGNMCLAPSWYLGIDTQLFILALVLIYFIKKYESKIYYILGGVLAVHMMILFLVNYILDYPAEMIPYPELIYDIGFLKSWHWHLTFSSFFANIAGLIVGLFYGYIYFKYKDVQLIQSRKWQIVYWILTYFFPLFTILGPGYLIFNENVEHNRLWASIHAAVSRTVFALGIGAGILGMTQGHGWLSKAATEFRPTYVLGRITYSTFLAHLMVIKLRPAFSRFPIFLNDYIIVSGGFSDIFMSYLFGLLITLFFELPISELQKMILPKQGKKEKKESKSD